jgi:hypothetical protein
MKIVKLKNTLLSPVYITASLAAFLDSPQGSSVSGCRQLIPVLRSVLRMIHTFKNSEEAQAANELVVFRKNKVPRVARSEKGFRLRRIARATLIDAKIEMK